MEAASVCANEMATWATGISRREATIADAYSQGSRTTTSGSHWRHVRSMVGSMALVASRPKSSRLPSTDASSGAARARSSRIAATSSSGGWSPAWNGNPAPSTISCNAGGPTTKVSSPLRRAAARTGNSGRRCPAPPREHAAITRMGVSLEGAMSVGVSPSVPHASKVMPGAGHRPRHPLVPGRSCSSERLTPDQVDCRIWLAARWDQPEIARPRRRRCDLRSTLVPTGRVLIDHRLVDHETTGDLEEDQERQPQQEQTTSDHSQLPDTEPGSGKRQRARRSRDCLARSGRSTPGPGHDP